MKIRSKLFRLVLFLLLNLNLILILFSSVTYAQNFTIDKFHALDVADNWAKAFEGIYQERPNWYAPCGEFRTFSPYGFSHSMNAVTSSLSSAMFSAPRGSGIGGDGGGGGNGGSSGGGFGGGGGGDW